MRQVRDCHETLVDAAKLAGARGSVHHHIREVEGGRQLNQ
jgi:hypothetical protein